MKLGIFGYEDLKSFEKMFAAAKEYYHYTDSLTKEKDDGKALFGANSIVNLVFVSLAELGHPITSYSGEEKIEFDRDSFRKIYDYIVLPYVMGYYGNEARFVTEDIRSGYLLAGETSSSSVPFFPPEALRADGSMREITGRVMERPHFEGAKKFFLLQGGGVFAFKKNEKSVEASVTFLRWLSSDENVYDFAFAKSYMPAKKSYFNVLKIEEVYQNRIIDRLTADSYLMLIDQFLEYEVYEPAPTENYEKIRMRLGNYLLSTIKEMKLKSSDLRKTMTVEEVENYYRSDEKFEKWFSGVLELR